jgi:hypothetical protein
VWIGGDPPRLQLRLHQLVLVTLLLLIVHLVADDARMSGSVLSSAWTVRSATTVRSLACVY